MSNKETIYNRIKKNFGHKSKWAKREQLQAWRLYHKDIPDFPYIVDIYDKDVVVYEFLNDKIDSEKINHKFYLLESLIEILNVSEKQIHFKSRKIQKRNEKYQKLHNSDHFISITEGPISFRVNLIDYLDTGLFLDHRPLRNWLVKKLSAGKNILNLFSYTGSLSVAAAIGGAKNIISVDLSSHYLNWAKENFKINNLPFRSEQFIEMDVITFLKNSKQNHFDLIIIDPPTFSNSKKLENDFDVEKNQWELISLAANKLTLDGVIYFSNNKKNFKLDSKITEQFIVQDLTEASIPIDFKNTKIHQLFLIKKKQ